MTATLPPPDIWLYIAIACAVVFVLIAVWAGHVERRKRLERGQRRGR